MISLIRARFIFVASAIIIGFMAGPYGVAEITLGESVSPNTTISPSDSYSDPNQSSHYLVETCNGSDPYSNFADTTGKPYASNRLIVRFKNIRYNPTCGVRN